MRSAHERKLSVFLTSIHRGLVEAQNDPYNPQDPMNIINSQGYGLLWSESEATEGAERPAVYTVVGCKGKNSPVSKTSFNTNTGSGSNKGCQVLMSLF
jgi:hypothetical protein